MNAKPFWKSKTLLFNALSLVVLTFGLVVDAAGELALDPHLVVWLGIGIVVVNAALRLVTYRPISNTPGDTLSTAAIADSAATLRRAVTGQVAVIEAPVEPVVVVAALVEAAPIPAAPPTTPPGV